MLDFFPGWNWSFKLLLISHVVSNCFKALCCQREASAPTGGLPEAVNFWERLVTEALQHVDHVEKSFWHARQPWRKRASPPRDWRRGIYLAHDMFSCSFLNLNRNVSWQIRDYCCCCCCCWCCGWGSWVRLLAYCESFRTYTGLAGCHVGISRSMNLAAMLKCQGAWNTWRGRTRGRGIGKNNLRAISLFLGRFVTLVCPCH